LEETGPRRRTVTNKNEGTEILQRAKTAVVTQEIEEEIEEASLIMLKKVEQASFLKVGTVNSVPQERVEQGAKTVTRPAQNSQIEDEESLITSIDQELSKTEMTRDTGPNVWKSKCEALEQQVDKLQQENNIFQQENLQLHQLVETMKKRLALRSN